MLGVDVNSNVNMAALLDSYEQQYGIISASITAKTAKLSGTSLGKYFWNFFQISDWLFNQWLSNFIVGEDRRIVIQQIVKELEEARDIVNTKIVFQPTVKNIHENLKFITSLSKWS